VPPPKKQNRPLLSSIGLSASVLKTITSVIHPPIPPLRQREEPGVKEYTVKDITGKSSPAESSASASKVKPTTSQVNGILQAQVPFKSMISESTKRVLEDLKSNMVIKAPGVSTKELLDENSLKYKHSQLIAIKRELVMPGHYKRLLELQRFVDVSLNFIK